MSLYKSIKKTLFGLYKSKQKGHSKRRLVTMAGMITGLLRSKKGTIHSIGKRFPSKSDLESRIKRVKRSLGNKWNDWEFQYLPCLQKILHILSKQGHIKLIIDGSQMGSSCTALMLSVLWGDTAIPLCWLVRQAPKGHFPSEMHKDLVEQIAPILKAVLPKKCYIVLLGDGEFSNCLLQQTCLDVGFDYVFRLAKDTPLYEDEVTLDSDKKKQEQALDEAGLWLFTLLGQNTEGVSRYEKDIKTFEELDKKETYSDNAILVTGSSYIRLWANIKTDLAPQEIIQRGYGGSNGWDMAYYIRRILTPHPKLKAIVFYTGSNDITATAKDKSPRQVLEIFKYIVKTIRETHPNTPIYWIQISPNERRWAVWDKIQEANQLFEAYAAQTPNVKVIKAASCLLGEDGKPIVKYFRADKLHLNDEGYQVWAKSILPQLLK